VQDAGYSSDLRGEGDLKGSHEKKKAVEIPAYAPSTDALKLDRYGLDTIVRDEKPKAIIRTNSR
jgi:hypothetical protein